MSSNSLSILASQSVSPVITTLMESVYDFVPGRQPRFLPPIIPYLHVLQRSRLRLRADELRHISDAMLSFAPELTQAVATVRVHRPPEFPDISLFQPRDKLWILKAPHHDGIPP